jgi:SAM-dependent methyltransferase
MKIDLQKIEKFYDTDLGQYAGDVIMRSLSKIIPTQKLEKTTCICSSGAFHYTSLFKDNTKRLAFQSYNIQKKYPNGGESHHIVTDRLYWPYRAEDADFVVMIHDLEFAESPEEYLREAWRVLKGEGQLIIVFPNRSGAWAKYDNNPFGHGYPYTLDQLKKLLSKAHFTVGMHEGLLFFPAYQPKTRIGQFYRYCLDKMGSMMLFQPGLVIVKASKHIYAPSNGLKINAAEKAKQVLFPKTVPTPKTTNLLK